MADNAARLARTIDDIVRRLSAVERGSQLSRSSLQVDGETVSVKDAVRASITASQKAAEAIDRATAAEDKVDGVVNTYYTDDGTPPTDPGIGTGDFWFRRDTKDTATWDGDSWNPVTSSAVRAAIEAADLAAAAADGKISTFYAAANKPPVGAGEGDIWFVTDQKNRQRRFNGTAWIDVRDGGIADALDAASDAASDAAGAQEAALVAMNSANGKTKVVWSTADPGSTAGVNLGDTWFTHDGNGYVLRQWKWDGVAWQSMTLTNATVTSLDAGRITTGTLAAGVSIVAGTPGWTRTELSSSGLFGYVGNNLRFSLGGGSATMVADLFQSANYVNGGTSYVQIGDLGDGDSVDGIRLVRPGNSQVTLKNGGSGGAGIFQLDFKDSGGTRSGGYTFTTSGLQSQFGYLAIGASSPGSMSIGYGYSLNAGGYTAFYDAGSHYFGGPINFNVYASASMEFANSYDGSSNPKVGRVNGVNLKFVGNEALQARFAYDGGYAYIRGLLQDQSNPALKENITELNVDALAELSGMKFYAYDWIRDPQVPFVRPPRDSSTGLLLSEVPNVVQQTDDGYATGSLLGLVVAAVNQLATQTAALEARLA